MKMRLSSSLPNDPKYANGRVYYDNLVKHLTGNGLGEQIEVQFFPDNQLRNRVLPQTEEFVKAHPDAKPVVDKIRSTSA